MSHVGSITQQSKIKPGDEYNITAINTWSDSMQWIPKRLNIIDIYFKPTLFPGRSN